MVEMLSEMSRSFSRINSNMNYLRLNTFFVAVAGRRRLKPHFKTEQNVHEITWTNANQGLSDSTHEQIKITKQ